MGGRANFATLHGAGRASHIGGRDHAIQLRRGRPVQRRPNPGHAARRRGDRAWGPMYEPVGV